VNRCMRLTQGSILPPPAPPLCSDVSGAPFSRRSGWAARLSPDLAAVLAKISSAVEAQVRGARAPADTPPDDALTHTHTTRADCNGRCSGCKGRRCVLHRAAPLQRRPLRRPPALPRVQPGQLRGLPAPGPRPARRRLLRPARDRRRVAERAGLGLVRDGLPGRALWRVRPRRSQGARSRGPGAP